MLALDFIELGGGLLIAAVSQQIHRLVINLLDRALFVRRLNLGRTSRDRGKRAEEKRAEQGRAQTSKLGMRGKQLGLTHAGKVHFRRSPGRTAPTVGTRPYHSDSGRVTRPRSSDRKGVV